MAIGFMAAVAVAIILATFLMRPEGKRENMPFEPDWSLTYKEALVVIGESALEIADQKDAPTRFIRSQERILEAFGMSGYLAFKFEGDTLIEIYHVFYIPISTYPAEEPVIIDIENHMNTIYELVLRAPPEAIIGYRANWINEDTMAMLDIARSSEPGLYALSMQLSNKKYYDEKNNNRFQKDQPPPQAPKIAIEIPSQ